MKAHLSRRTIIKSAAVAGASLCIGWPMSSAARAAASPLRFGLMADPHKDVMHDTDERLRVFIDEMKKQKPDFILQLGDFCTPKPKNESFVKIWEEFEGPCYHTLGNHDTDGGFKQKQTMDFWKMPEPYYSFDHSGWHFIVLNGNEVNPAHKPSGYARFISKKQIDWLEADLKKTEAPTILFSHQSLEDPEGVENQADVRAVIEKANADAGWRKVGACLSGHHHIDYQREINGIPYIQINSMSYHWLGGNLAHDRYTPEISKAFPSIRSTVPYKDALYATVSLDPKNGLEIKGIASEFVGPDPWQSGLVEKKGTRTDRDRLVPKISDRHIELPMKA